MALLTSLGGFRPKGLDDPFVKRAQDVFTGKAFEEQIRPAQEKIEQYVGQSLLGNPTTPVTTPAGTTVDLSPLETARRKQATQNLLGLLGSGVGVQAGTAPPAPGDFNERVLGGARYGTPEWFERTGGGPANPAIPFLKSVQEAVGDIGATAGRIVDPLARTTPTGAILEKLGVSTEEAGRFAGETIVPTTPLELGALALPSVGQFGRGVSAGLPIGTAARRAALTGVEQLLPTPNLNEPLPRIPSVGTRLTQAPAALGGAEAIVRRGDPLSASGRVLAGASEAPPVSTVDDLAGNIRLDKFPEDLRGTIKSWADANPDVIAEARRGTIPDEEVRDMARQLVDDVGGDFDKLQRRWKPGQAWSAEEVTAIRGTLNTKTQAVLDAATAARTSGSMEDQVRLVAAIQEQSRVQEIVTGVTAEAGRALRAFRQEADEALGAGDLAGIRALLRKVGGEENIDAFAKALANIDPSNPAHLQRLLRDFDKPGFWDYASELWINGLLSGPKTHLVNSLSNSVNAALSAPERAMSAGVDVVLSAAQKRARARFLSEAPADLIGALQGLPEGMRAAMYTMRNGITPGNVGKFEYRKQAFKGPLGRIIRTPSTLLEAADQFFYHVNYSAALNANAVRMARQEGLKGDAILNRVADLKLNTPRSLVKSAKETAEYRIYRGDPGAFANWLMKGREEAPALRFVVPFIKTPANLLKYGLERSPAGFFNPKLWRNLAAKSPEASDQIARAMLGSALTMGVGVAVAEGKLDITAAAPVNSADRDRFYREGKLPFSIKIGDQWISYQRVEPLNQPLTQLAGAIEALRSGETDPTAILSQAVATIGKNFNDQTFLTGISDILNAIDDPTRWAKSYMQRQAASAVPGSSLLRQTSQIMNPTIRDPEGIAEQIQANIPGLTGNVPERLTAFGEPSQRATPFSPVAISTERQGVVDAELERTGVRLGFVGDSIAGKDLTREQRYEYQEVAGQVAKQVLTALIESAEYEGLSEEQKVQVLERGISRARDKVREVLAQMYGFVEEEE